MAANMEEETFPCDYKKCPHPDDKLSHVTSRAEVKSYVPKMKTVFLVNWDAGEARLVQYIKMKGLLGL